MSLADRIARVLELDPDSPAIEFQGKWYPWRFLSELGKRLDAELTRAGIGAGETVAIMASNRPTTVAAMAALIASRRPVMFINPSQPETQLGEELSTLRPRALAADHSEWKRGPVVDALRGVGAIGLVLDEGGEVSLLAGLERPGAGPFYVADRDAALIQTTSGTTGPPKRTTRTVTQLEETLAIGHPQSKNEDAATLKVKRSPALAFKSMAHAGGANSILLALYEARPISLHEKFSVEAFAEAVQRHKPKVTSLVPAMLRMIWDAGADRQVTSG